MKTFLLKTWNWHFSCFASSFTFTSSFFFRVANKLNKETLTKQRQKNVARWGSQFVTLGIGVLSSIKSYFKLLIKHVFLYYLSLFFIFLGKWREIVYLQSRCPGKSQGFAKFLFCLLRNSSQCEIKLGAILVGMASVVENTLLEKRFSCCFLTPLLYHCFSISLSASSVHSIQL